MPNSPKKASTPRRPSPRRASSPRRPSTPRRPSPKKESPELESPELESPDTQEIDMYISEKLRSVKNEKKAIIMVGGPGSGKTSGLNVLINMLKKNKDDFVSIDPDDILKTFFNSNRKYYSKVEPINKALYEKTLEGNYNLIFDRTGTNYDSYYNTVIKKIKEEGYNIVLCIVYNNYYSVKARLKKREAETGRAVNETYARNSYRDLTFNIPKYVNLNCDDTDDIFVFDNTSSSIELIYRSQCKKGEKTVTINNLI